MAAEDGQAFFMDKSQEDDDEVLYEVQEGTVLLPVNKKNSKGIHKSKIFRVNETFF